MQKVKVKMLTGISGLANPAYDLGDHSYAPEEIVMLHPRLASAWIDGGIAQAVREKTSVPPEYAPAPVASAVPSAAATEQTETAKPQDPPKTESTKPVAKARKPSN